MSNTAITKEAQKLMALRKENGIKILRPQSINVHISQGRVVIEDYSINDDRKKLLALMAALGALPKDISESWCG